MYDGSVDIRGAVPTSELFSETLWSAAIDHVVLTVDFWGKGDGERGGDRSLTLGERDQSGLAGRVVRKYSNSNKTTHTGNLDDMPLISLDHVRPESSQSKPDSLARLNSKRT